MKSLSIILFFFSLNLHLYCQELRHFSTEDGLPQDVTYNIYPDHLGYIWFGTDDGLVRFNGKEFKLFTENDGLNNNYVIDIKPYTKDTLAIATWGGGLNFYANGKIVSAIDNDDHKTNELLLHNGLIYTYHTFFNLKYYKELDKWKLSRFVLDSLIQYNENVFDLTSYSPRFSEAGNQLFAHNRLIKEKKIRPLKGVFQFKQEKFTRVFPFLDDFIISVIFKSSNGDYYAADPEGLIVFNPSGIKQKIQLDIQNESILKILELNDEEILILAANDNGFKNAYRFNFKTSQLINFRGKYDIKSTISDIALDFENNIWLTTDGGGIYQIKENLFDIKTILKDVNVIDIAFFKGKTYCLSPTKVYEYKDYHLENTYELKGFGKKIIVQNDELHIRSVKLAGQVKSNTFIQEKMGFNEYKDENIRIIAKDSFSINGEPLLDMPTTLNAVEARENKYWLGTNTGLYEYSYLENRMTKHTHPFLEKVRITDFKRLGDYFWIGTSNGLVKEEKDSFQRISVSDGLLNNHVKKLDVSHDNRLWIATANGLTVFDGISFVNFTKDENLISNNINVVKEDSNHNIWVATVKGISILNNQTKPKKQILPKVLVKQDDLKFDIEVISFASANNLFTQYQIDEEPWKTIQTRTIDFENFKEGDYVFQVRSKKPNSNWKYSKKFDVKVQVPFFQKSSFIALVVIVISSLIIMLISYRLKKSRKMNFLLTESIQKQKNLEVKLTTVRENIAEDFHDDLGNKLASITILTDMLSDKVNSSESKDIVNQILGNSDSLYKGTKDFIWSLKKESDQLEEMVTYLSDFGEDFFEQLHIKFKIEKDLEKNIRLPYYWSRHIILIFKEAMTNTAKHSKSTECSISFSFKEGRLVILLEDNGYGFDINKVSLESGLKHMKDRAQKIGGEIEIQSSSTGTKISFTGVIYPN